MKYMYVDTGSVDTKQGWIESYPIEELEDRKKTAKKCWEEDLEKGQVVQVRRGKTGWEET